MPAFFKHNNSSVATLKFFHKDMDVPELIFVSQTVIEFISTNSLRLGGSINFGIVFICRIVCKAKMREIVVKLGDIDIIQVITVPKEKMSLHTAGTSMVVIICKIKVKPA